MNKLHENLDVWVRRNKIKLSFNNPRFAYFATVDARVRAYLDHKRAVETEEARKKREAEKEEKKRKLAEWEELQKARSLQVAKDWYAQMQEANGLWQKAISDLEAKKAAAATDATENQSTEESK